MTAEIEIYARPTWLYRYRSLGMRKVKGAERIDRKLLERELTAIEQNYIYCPTYDAMNDPMEGLYYATRRVRQSADYERVVEQVRNEKLRLGIAAMCESWDNELMWAHYANGFRGICVAYQFSRLIRGLPTGHALARVMYGDRPYSLALADLRNEPERARAVLSTKNIRWTYEREWRLFAPSAGPAFHGPDAVTHVYLGARLPEADRERVTRRLENAGIEVRPTQVDGYQVEREDYQDSKLD